MKKQIIEVLKNTNFEHYGIRGEEYEVEIMKRFEIRLDRELHEKLREESFITEKSMHEIVIELIEDHYNKKERLEMLRLIEMDHGVTTELFEGTLEEVVEYLKENEDLYNWILDEDEEAEQPDLENIEVLRDLEYELEKIDLSWWKLEVEELD